MSAPLPTSDGAGHPAEDRPSFDAEDARRRWQARTEETHRTIINGALDGRTVEEGVANDLALGWAWVILGPPWDRRRAGWRDFAKMLFWNWGLNGLTYWLRMGGSPEYDLVPVVRRNARVVERAYWTHRRM
jgi:hypothetical protein